MKINPDRLRFGCVVLFSALSMLAVFAFLRSADMACLIMALFLAGFSFVLDRRS